MNLHSSRDRQILPTAPDVYLRNSECYFCDVLSSSVKDTIGAAADTVALGFHYAE